MGHGTCAHPCEGWWSLRPEKDVSHPFFYLHLEMATRQMRCLSKIEVRPDEVDIMDQMADAKCSRLEMPARCRQIR